MPGVSTLTAKRKFGDPDGISGTVDFHPTDINKLVWTIDPSTLPVDTISPVDAIIDPTQNYPGDGLPLASLGQRYLIANDMAVDSAAWGMASGTANDIIEFDGADWIVAFDSETATNVEVTTNSLSGQQLRFSLEEKEWDLAVDGCYKPGTWRIASIPPLDEDCN